MKRFNRLCESYLNNHQEILDIVDHDNTEEWESGEMVFKIYQLLTPKERGDLFAGALPQLWDEDGRWDARVPMKDRQEIGGILSKFIDSL
jgi:hypothetical protein